MKIKRKIKRKIIFSGLFLILLLFAIYIFIPDATPSEVKPAISDNIEEVNGKGKEQEERASLEDDKVSSDKKNAQEEELKKSEESKKDTSKTTTTTTATNSNTTNYTTKYYIKVNNLQNVVTIYEKDGDGKYTVPVKAMICSTGTETPASGIYTTKYKWEWLGLFGDVYGHYVTQITGNILFHSVPYTAKSPDTLEYWEYDKLGTAASLGCVRLKVVDAKWVYDNISWGTPVEFYSSSESGPLGKPTAQKISYNVECRNWDPTDMDSRNPWNLKKEEAKNETEEVKKENESNNSQNEAVNIYTEIETDD